MRKAKIVCTIGPVSENRESLTSMIKAGMNVARLNFSHGDYEEQGNRIRMLKELREELGVPLGIMLDTKGPEVRLGNFRDGRATLVAGQAFTLTARDVQGDETIAQISHKGLPGDVGPGTQILLDDGLIELEVKSVKGEDILCEVKNGGEISNKKGVNLPGTHISMPAISQKDREDILFGCREQVDFIAASFVQSAQDVLSIRSILSECDSGDVFIIAKIENRQGVDNFEEILDVADGIMVARGDLGVEIPIEEVPLVQKRLIQLCNLAGKPVIIATQMLESMINNPRPTRAEANDVANSIIDGADAIMLSGETAKGKYPVEAVRVMDRIARNAQTVPQLVSHGSSSASITAAVSHACCDIAQDMGAKAIITPTRTGGTARMVSRHRPECPIIACSMGMAGYYRLSLIWGVIPLMVMPMTSTDDLIARCLRLSQEKGLLKTGDIAVITAGVPMAITGTTNLIHVQVVGDVLLHGKGIGSKFACGKVRNVHVPDSAAKFAEGDIMLARATDNSMLPMMKKAAALIVEDADLLGHAAMVGLSLDIPVVLAAESALDTLEDGMEVTVYAGNGYIYKGHTPGL